MNKRVDAINQLRKAANTLMPALQDYCKDAVFKLTVDNRMYKKDKEKLQDIINKYPQPEGLTIYLNESFTYTLYIEFKIRYERDAHSWNYISHSYSLCEKKGGVTAFETFIEKPLLDLSDVLAAIDTVKELDEQIDKLTRTRGKLVTAMELDL